MVSEGGGKKNGQQYGQSGDGKERERDVIRPWSKIKPVIVVSLVESNDGRNVAAFFFLGFSRASLSLGMRPRYAQVGTLSFLGFVDFSYFVWGDGEKLVVEKR